ncbi:ATP-binding protein [Streptomyces chartreusis]|uniref:ATP-binding protein n=1 Tax=Streptomyces chartreusis TaxID=1969 RepID=UPI0036A96D60
MPASAERAVLSSRRTAEGSVDSSGPSPQRAAATRYRDERHDVTWLLSHQPESVRQARKLTTKALHHWRVTENVSDAAVIVVSELVTNAVQYATPPLTLHLCHLQGGGLLIEVADGGQNSEIREGKERPDDEHGRGLAIVGMLTKATGINVNSTHTTRWARI